MVSETKNKNPKQNRTKKTKHRLSTVRHVTGRSQWISVTANRCVRLVWRPSFKPPRTRLIYVAPPVKFAEKRDETASNIPRREDEEPQFSISTHAQEMAIGAGSERTGLVQVKIEKNTRHDKVTRPTIWSGAAAFWRPLEIDSIGPEQGFSAR